MTDNAARKQRAPGRPWQKGQSGNPAGKPKGTRHLATRAAEALLDGEAEALTRKAIDKALEGDPIALRLCLDRLIAPRKDRPVMFEMPPIKTIADGRQAFGAIMVAVAAGALTPVEANEIARLVEVIFKTTELTELEARLRALEANR